MMRVMEGDGEELSAQLVTVDLGLMFLKYYVFHKSPLIQWVESPTTIV